MNVDFLKKEGVTHVVNTAKGLEKLGPRYNSAVEYAKKELKLVYLDMNWEDSTSFVIHEEDLVKCARFIHQARSSGGSVLVHCAQGKSRSSVATIAYLMATDVGRSFEGSLKFLRERRRMADPNPTFSEQLIAFGCSEKLSQLRKDLAVLDSHKIT